VRFREAIEVARGVSEDEAPIEQASARLIAMAALKLGDLALVKEMMPRLGTSIRFDLARRLQSKAREVHRDHPAQADALACAAAAADPLLLEAQPHVRDTVTCAAGGPPGR
jgi:hypothetical protein